jgi:hypothetical protein
LESLVFITALRVSFDIVSIYLQSVFPPKLSLGTSKRHHAVIYLHAQLKSQYTSNSLNKEVKIDPEEVGAGQRSMPLYRLEKRTNKKIYKMSVIHLGIGIYIIYMAIIQYET